MYRQSQSKSTHKIPVRWPLMTRRNHNRKQWIYKNMTRTDLFFRFKEQRVDNPRADRSVRWWRVSCGEVGVPERKTALELLQGSVASRGLLRINIAVNLLLCLLHINPQTFPIMICMSVMKQTVTAFPAAARWAPAFLWRFYVWTAAAASAASMATAACWWQSHGEADEFLNKRKEPLSSLPTWVQHSLQFSFQSGEMLGIHLCYWPMQYVYDLWWLDVLHYLGTKTEKRMLAFF